MKKYLFLSLCVVSLFSCKKGDNQKLEANNTPITDYMSTKQGSWWMYGSQNGDITIRRATGRDSFMLDREYNYYETTDTGSNYVTPEYFGKNGDKFLMLVDLDGSMSKYMAVVVSKDSAQVGDEFSNTANMTYSAIPLNLLTEGDVVSTNESMTINNHTYDNLVKVKNALKAKPVISPSYINCGSVTMWIKPGLGIVRAEFDIHISSFYSRQYTDSLIDYHIEP